MSKIRVGFIIPDSKKGKIKLPSRLTPFCEANNLELVDINIEQNDLEDLKEFDILVHKIVDFCNDVDTNEAEIQRKKDLVVKYAQKHPNMKIVDDFENCEKITSRTYQTEVLLNAQCCIDNVKVFVPKILSVPAKFSLKELQSLVLSNHVKFPILSKPVNASMAEGSHSMKLVFSFDHLGDIEAPCLLQEFRNHGGVLYKVFVVGNNYKMCERPSIQDLFSTNNKTLYFDTRDVSKTGRLFIPDIHGKDPNKRVWKSCADVPDLLKHNVVKEVIQRIKLKTKFHLFGFDILIDSVTHDYALIDLNQFPGFSGVKAEIFENDLIELFKNLAQN